MWRDASSRSPPWHAGDPRGINRPWAGDHRHEGAPSATWMTPVADAADRQPAKDWTGHASRSTTVVSAPAPAAGGRKKPARFVSAWAHAASSSLAWRTPMSCRTLLLAFFGVVAALNAAARVGT